MSDKLKSWQCYNLLYYKPKLWEQVVLFFCPLLQHDAENSIIWYKKFSNRMYIYGYIRAHGVSSDTYTTGSNSTQGYDNAGNN
jgi:hypothetical protein